MLPQLLEECVCIVELTTVGVFETHLPETLGEGPLSQFCAVGSIVSVDPPTWPVGGLAEFLLWAGFNTIILCYGADKESPELLFRVY